MLTLLAFPICAFCMFFSQALNKRQKNALFVLCLIMLAMLSGFRDQGGSDFYVYRGIYDNTPLMPDLFSYHKTDFNYEIGYVYLCSFLKTLGISFYGFLVLHSLFFFTCLWYGFKKYIDQFGLLIIIFLYKLFFYNAFISMRQSITVAGFFILFHFIEQRKWIAYYIGCYILSWFHNGAYLLFLLYPLSFFEMTKTRLIWLNIIFIPTSILGFAGIDVMGPIGDILSSQFSTDAEVDKIDRYFSNDNLSPIGIFHTLEYFLIMFFVIINYKKIESISPHFQIVIKLFLCLLPLFTLLRGSEILTREKDYFTLFYAIILYYITIINKGKYKWLVLLVTCLICAFGYYRFLILFDNGALWQYKSWIGNSSFFL